MNVGCGFKPRKRGPQKVHGAARGAFRLVAQHHERPSRKRRMGGDARWGVAVGVKRRAGDHETSPAEHSNVGDIGRRRHGWAEFTRQVANGITQAEPDTLRTFVHLRTAVVECVHRKIREHVEVGLRIGARQHVFQRRSEVAQVHVLIGDKQELLQGQLPLAQNAEGACHGFAAVPLFDDRAGQRVISRLAIRPEVQHGGHDQWEQRRQQVLQEVANKKILLSGFAHHRRGINRVAAVRHLRHLKHRVIVLQRVIPVVITKRAFRFAHVWRHLPHQRKLGIGDKWMWMSVGPRHLRDLLAGHQRREQQLGNVLR